MISANLTSYVGSGLLRNCTLGPRGLRLHQGWVTIQKKKKNLPQNLRMAMLCSVHGALVWFLFGFECHHCFFLWPLAVSAYLIMDQGSVWRAILQAEGREVFETSSALCSVMWAGFEAELCAVGCVWGVWNSALPCFPDSLPWKKKAIKVLCCLLAWQESFSLDNAFIGKFVCVSPSLAFKNQVCRSYWWYSVAFYFKNWGKVAYFFKK